MPETLISPNLCFNIGTLSICENVITTHGYTDIFARHLNGLGLNAVSEKTEYEQETPETENPK